MRLAFPLFAALAALPPQAFAASSEMGAGPGVFASHDSEGFSVSRYQVYALPAYQNADALTGTRLSYARFSQSGWQTHGEQASFIHRQGNPGDKESLQLDLGFYREGDHQMVSLDADYARQFAERTRVEVFATRDWVETAVALDRGIYFTFAGAALEQGIGEHVTIVGQAATQHFSDGNHRTHGRWRLIYQPFLDSGLTLQVRQSVFHSSMADVDRAYFNPENYRRTLAGVGYRQRFQGWVATATAAAGPQKVDGDESKGSKLLELSLESPRTNHWSFQLRGGYSRAAGFNGPDYDYRYLQAEWLLAF